MEYFKEKGFYIIYIKTKFSKNNKSNNQKHIKDVLFLYKFLSPEVHQIKNKIIIIIIEKKHKIQRQNFYYYIFFIFHS